MVGLMINNIKPEEYDEMVDLALSLLQDYNLFKFPLDLPKLCSLLNIKLIPYSTLSSEQYLGLIKKGIKSGHTVVTKFSDGKMQYDTYYNDEDETQERNRFTIAHEIKHVVNGDFDKIKKEKNEDLADYFAKCLLAPQCVILAECINDVNSLAKKFKVSKQCADIWMKTIQKRVSRYGDDCLRESEINYSSLYNEYTKKNKKEQVSHPCS